MLFVWMFGIIEFVMSMGPMSMNLIFSKKENNKERVDKNGAINAPKRNP